MNILICFMGTGCFYKKSWGATPHRKQKNIGVAKSSYYEKIYYINGPGVFNIAGWTTKKAYDVATKILPDEIKNILESKPGENIFIFVRGHSRGGTTSDKFYRYLVSQFGTNDKVKLTLKNSDAYYGPTAKKENALNRFKKEDKKADNKIIVAYAAQTLFRCTPQQIVGADIIVVTSVGHNKSYDTLGDKNLPRTSGLYIGEKQSDGYKFTQITKENVKEYFEFIYKYGKVTQTNRWRLFTSILIQRLGFKSYDDLEKATGTSTSILFPNVKKEFDVALDSIQKSANLKSAFKTANKLFLPGGIFSGLGGSNFHNHLSNAEKAVCGIKNNDVDMAITELSQIVNKTGRPSTSIKSMTANTLIDRIKKWYKLK